MQIIALPGDVPALFGGADGLRALDVDEPAAGEP